MQMDTSQNSSQMKAQKPKWGLIFLVVLILAALVFFSIKNQTSNPTSENLTIGQKQAILESLPESPGQTQITDEQKTAILNNQPKTNPEELTPEQKRAILEGLNN